jgi:Ca2+-binding RTX toxin-like protein
MKKFRHRRFDTVSVKHYAASLARSYRLAVPLAVVGLLAASTGFAQGQGGGRAISSVTIGADNNSTANTFLQPADPALSGGGRDQTLQFGDILIGTNLDDLQIGRLGVDVMDGGKGSDVLIGGPEAGSTAPNADRAFGDTGNDIFIWAPGDGSDFFDGGKGTDVLVIGAIDRTDGEVTLDPESKLPGVEVTNNAGFCQIVDPSTSTNSVTNLTALGLDRLVLFFARGPADSFEAGTQTTDNGLRVTMHLRSVEILVCTNREGGAIEVFDMTVSPARPLPFESLSARVQAIVR